MHIDERPRLISLSCILQTDYKCAFTNHKKVKLNEYPHCRDTLYLTWLLKKTRANVKTGNESANCRYVNKNNWQRICKIAFKKTKQNKKQKTKQEKIAYLYLTLSSLDISATHPRRCNLPLPGLSILNILYPHVYYQCIAMGPLFQLIPKKLPSVFV